MYRFTLHFVLKNYTSVIEMFPFLFFFFLQDNHLFQIKRAVK